MNTFTSLNEKINEVLNSRASKFDKANELVKLQLTKSDIERLLFMDSKGKVTRTHRFAYTFGVEIECDVNMSLANEALRANGVECHYEGYNHRDHTNGAYKFVTDSSVHGDNPIECVSPVLDGNNTGFDSLKACVRSLNDAGVRVNSTCGLHVHMAVKDMSDRHYINIFKNYQALEGVIDSFMANSRRGSNSQWCASLRNHDFSGCHTKDDVRRELGYDRYHKVNAEAYLRHRTVEFRQHQGTCNYEKITMWVRFLARLVEYSKNNLVAGVSTIDEIPFLASEEKAFFNARKAELA